jgi:hypothetical protein
MHLHSSYFFVNLYIQPPLHYSHHYRLVVTALHGLLLNYYSCAAVR